MACVRAPRASSSSALHRYAAVSATGATCGRAAITASNSASARSRLRLAVTRASRTRIIASAGASVCARLNCAAAEDRSPRSNARQPARLDAIGLAGAGVGRARQPCRACAPTRSGSPVRHRRRRGGPVGRHAPGRVAPGDRASRPSSSCARARAPTGRDGASASTRRISATARSVSSSASSCSAAPSRPRTSASCGAPLAAALSARRCHAARLRAASWKYSTCTSPRRCRKCGLPGYRAVRRSRASSPRLRLLLVPEVDPVQLVQRFAGDQLSARLGGLHVAQAGDLVAAGQQQQEAEKLGGRRRDVRVVPCRGRCRTARPRASASRASARSSASLIRLPSRAAARCSPRSTRHDTRAPYAPPR